MKRLLCVLVGLVILIAALSGCEANKYTEGGVEHTGSGVDYSAAAPEAANSGASEGEQGTNPPEGRMIIRNAELDMVVKDVSATYDALLKFAAEHGGYEVNRNQRKVNGYQNIDAQIRVKPEKLEAFLDFAKSLADDKTNENVDSRTYSDDITDRYYDTEIRLKNMEKALERYYEFLKQAENIEESLAVQARIDELTVKIESLKGALSRWDKQLAESTITIKLRQLDDPIKIRREIKWTTLSLSDTGYLIKTGFKAVINIVVSILQWLAIILIAGLPLWIVGFIVLLVIRRIRKKKSNK